MPSSFTTPLELEYIDGRTWKVTREFDYLVDYEDEETTIRIPEGFTTDFASIPEILWNILPPTGKYGKAAVVHDYLYVMGGRVSTGYRYDKAQADRIFLEAMEVLGVGWLERKLMYRAVRWFGRGNFGKV